MKLINTIRIAWTMALLAASVAVAQAQQTARVIRVDPLLISEPIAPTDSVVVVETEVETVNALLPDSTLVSVETFDAVEAYEETDTLAIIRRRPISIYAMPYSWELSNPDWSRLKLNTTVLGTAFLTTLFVLQMLPEDATDWNKAKFQNTPFWERWFQNVFKRGPHFDGDLFIFNYVLHPYAGAAYFMGARSCGFNFAQSLVYSAFISTVFWEFGIEACMERPSIQDIFITPLLGSLLGEGFYRVKRHLVENNYHLAGSWLLGHVVAFVVDPINEVIGLFAGNPARQLGKVVSQPLLIPQAPGEAPAVGISVTAVF